MSKEVDVITEEFEKLCKENREQLTDDLEEKSPASPVLQFRKIRCTSGEVCHGGDVIEP